MKYSPDIQNKHSFEGNRPAPTLQLIQNFYNSSSTAPERLESHSVMSLTGVVDKLASLYHRKAQLT